MSEYRFHLQKYKPGCKLSCPSCGKKRCFVKYVDDEGKVIFPDTVGKCDHENSCGYHYTPKEFFHDNPEALPKLDDGNAPLYNKVKATVGIKKSQPAPPSIIPPELMKQSLAGYGINPLFAYLCGVMGKEEANRLFRLYQVGTSKKWGGSTVYWQIDVNSKIRTGKIMNYDRKTGHRIKEPQSYVTWVHSEVRLPDFHLVQCLFGEHLLPLRPDAPVMLVESEKTAIIMSHFIPDYLWLATGGKNGCFNETAIKVLSGRKVVLMPDLGATEEWLKKSRMLESICESVTVFDGLEKSATDEQRQFGLDIADFYLMEPTKHQILEDMIRRNPAVKLLIEKLDLEICDEE